jgi:hypothetical protein
MRDLLPPIFQIATGLTFLCCLVVFLGARRAIRRPSGRAQGFGLLLGALGFLFLSWGTAEPTLGEAAAMILAGGAAFLAALLLVAIGLAMAARQSP